MSQFSPSVRQKVGEWTFLSNMTEHLRSSYKLRHVWCRLRPSSRSHTKHLRFRPSTNSTITHCLHLLADKSYCTIDASVNLLYLPVGSCAVPLAPGNQWAASSSDPTNAGMARARLTRYRKQTSSHSKYNSQNKSPVYCQTTNFAHTSKQAVIKEKSLTKQRGKEKRLFSLALPSHTNKLVMVQLKYIH